MLLHNGLALATIGQGHRPPSPSRHRRRQPGRPIRVDDPDLALAVVAGATLGLGQLLHDQPDRDDAHATDQVTEDLLRMLGVPADEAHRICLRPFPTPIRPATNPRARGHAHPHHSGRHARPLDLSQAHRSEAGRPCGHGKRSVIRC